jgi:hypothetical protein
VTIGAERTCSAMPETLRLALGAMEAVPRKCKASGGGLTTRATGARGIAARTAAPVPRPEMARLLRHATDRGAVAALGDLPAAMVAEVGGYLVL